MRRVKNPSRDESSLPSPTSARPQPRLRLSRGRNLSDDGLREVHTRSSKRYRLFPRKPLGKALVFLAFLVVLLIVRWMLSDFLLLVRFKFSNKLDTRGWRTSLRLRKPPLLWIHSTTSAAIVFEANHLAADGSQHLAVRWRKEPSKESTEAEVRMQRPEGENGWRRWIHSTLLEPLEPGASYTYEVYLAPSKAKKTSKKGKVLAKRTFLWTGQEPAADFVSDSKTPPTSPVHIACLGDNQFRLAVFSRVLSSLARLRKYLPSTGSAYGPRTEVSFRRTSTPKQPHLLLHVGDAVQGPHDLDQWQTDFWDPLTRGYAPSSFSGTMPLLYARGNHDFDEDGKNLYTAGLPRVQKGELNRTAVRQNPRWTGFAIPGTAEGDQMYAAHESAPRAEGDRSTYFAYSPHPRARILVLDSNLIDTRVVPGSTQNAPSEVAEQERWLIWEMGRSEWRDASFRIVVVHAPPFVERWERKAWEEGGESQWAIWVRTRLAPHWHAMSDITRQYEMPPATLVLSGHSHTYARGLLANFAAAAYFSPLRSSDLPEDSRLASKGAHVMSGGYDGGVIYTIIGGAGGTFDTDRVERWGFYEKSVLRKHHFVHMMLDFVDETTVRTPMKGEHERRDYDRRKRVWAKDKTRVYFLGGTEVPCAGKVQGADRLIWSAWDLKGKVIDRFVVEAPNCRG